MSQLIAGETVTFVVDDVTLNVKIEDASKGDVFSAKILSASPESNAYKVDQVSEFNRQVLA